MNVEYLFIVLPLTYLRACYLGHSLIPSNRFIFESFLDRISRISRPVHNFNASIFHFYFNPLLHPVVQEEAIASVNPSAKKFFAPFRKSVERDDRLMGPERDRKRKRGVEEHREISGEGFRKIYAGNPWNSLGLECGLDFRCSGGGLGSQDLQSCDFTAGGRFSPKLNLSITIFEFSFSFPLSNCSHFTNP